MEAYFLNTGRLTSLQPTMTRIFKILLQLQSDPALHVGVQSAMESLSKMQGNDDAVLVSYPYDCIPMPSPLITWHPHTIFHLANMNMTLHSS